MGGSGREFVKIALEERHLVLSCSTSKRLYESVPVADKDRLGQHKLNHGLEHQKLNQVAAPLAPG